MKQILTSLLIILQIGIHAQVMETFSDGDFSADPQWIGDTSQFEVNSSGQLQLHSSGVDTSFLFTANSLFRNTEWNFWVKLSFNTSANNYARFYMVSDHPDPGSFMNGYFLQIGGSHDSIEFYRQNGSTVDKLFTGSSTSTNHSSNTMRIKMIHDKYGIWRLFIDRIGGLNYQEEGAIMDSTLTSASWSGIFCRYTGSNSTKFYFDDIYVGPVIEDTIAPGIVAVDIINDTQIEVMFSEPVDIQAAEMVSNYLLSKTGNPLQAVVDTMNPGNVVLTFSIPFPDSTCDTLKVMNIKDLHENTMDITKVNVCRHLVHAFDILIDEIMADPDTPVNLPEVEFVELFNRSDFPVRIKDWIFSFGNSQKILPDMTLLSHEYLILTKGNTLNNYGKTLDLFSSSTSLANDGSTLVLRDNRGKVIHSVAYSTDWYNNPLKSAGGWSLEMIDPANPCGCGDNWNASIDPSGGTPGKINSVHHRNPDTISPQIVRAVIKDSVTIRVFFSEPMDSLSLMDITKWTVDQEMANPERITPISPDFHEAGLTLPRLVQRNIVYSISPGEELKDCAGNPLTQQRTIRVAYPDTVDADDIIINEILSNPAIDGEKFIEIYNRSDKILDLGDVVLSSFDTLTNTMADPVNISEENWLFFPGDYIVLTVNPEDIMHRYMTPGEFAFIKLSDMPSLGKEEGIAVISRKTTGEIIDRVNYSKDMQFALLISTAGISLERMNPSIPSDERDNWHSAGSSCGYATPGYQNSQNINTDWASETIQVTPQIFTPDNDGKNDVLVIRIHPEEPGFMCNVTLFDEKGRTVRQLVRNRLLSGDDYFTWDGIDDNGRKADIGIYVLYIELLKTDGTVKRFKKAVVLGGHL